MTDFKRTTVFEIAEHEEHGFRGARPVDMPHADPGSGFTLAHDMLEHVDGDDGGIGAEFAAIGAIAHTRGDAYGAQTGVGSAHADPVAEGLAGDLTSDLYRHFAHEGFALETPPADAPEADEHVEQSWAEAFRKAKRQIADEQGGADWLRDNPDEAATVAEWLAPESRAKMLGWLRAGYAAAVERYGSIGTWELCHAFVEIEKAADAAIKHADAEGQRFRVTVWAEGGGLSHRIEHVEPCYHCGADDYEECGCCPECGLNPEHDGHAEDCDSRARCDECDEFADECERWAECDEALDLGNADAERLKALALAGFAAAEERTA